MYASVTTLKNRYPKIYRKCTFINIALLVVIITVLWNEYISYMVVSWKWSRLKGAGQLDRSEDELRVMFVADPQLIGLHHELPWISPISQWDADRYMRRTFVRAYNHIKPEVVVFLGDLLDEAYTANDEEYLSYVARFHDIFQIEKFVQTVYISGDNDVGGEGFEPKLDTKVAAFNQHFLPGQHPPSDLVPAKFVDFIRLSLLSWETVMTKIQKELAAISEQSSGLYRVLCNHESILNRRSNDQNDVISITRANLIFTAHSHKSVLYTCNDCHDDFPNRRGHRLFTGVTTHIEDSRVYTLDLTAYDLVNEIVVPTCSYRMGVPAMGYSSALFDREGRVQYTVLWQPSRYSQLIQHGYCMAIVGLLIGWILVRRCGLGKIVNS